MGQFTEREVAETMKQIMCGLSFAHKANLIHRDIKLENIMMEVTHNAQTGAEEMHIKIIDWGTGEFVTKQGFQQKRIGTLDYAAPEIFTLEQQDQKVDVWSCGVVFFALLCGGLPFDQEDGDHFDSCDHKSRFDCNRLPPLRLSLDHLKGFPSRPCLMFDTTNLAS